MASASAEIIIPLRLMSAETASFLRPLFLPRLFAVSLVTINVPVAAFQRTLNILFMDKCFPFLK
ncbi:hypothetical protein GHW89_18685 [Salmonella enterica]|nr:hypothetical protein [Salmonella enterica]